MESSLGSYYKTTLLISSLGTTGGWLYRHDTVGMFWGLVCGFVLSLIVWFKGLVKYQHPELFFEMHSESGAPQVILNEKATTIISLTLPGGSKRQIRGLDEDEWHKLAQGVVERGYRYTVRDLQDIFNSQTEGNRIYGRITETLITATVLERTGSNGVGVTDDGRKFFDMLDRHEYKILDMFSPSPDAD